jgi:hypothetical protein
MGLVKEAIKDVVSVDEVVVIRAETEWVLTKGGNDLILI